MKKAYLALGANLGDPAGQLEEAIRRLDSDAHIHVFARSTMIVSPAWGKTDQPDFTNMVLGVETSLKPAALLRACLGIENQMGRVRGEPWGPRLIDIDIIAYEDHVIRTPGLTLPHPYAHSRAFVLDPLREIAPAVADWVVRRSTSPQ